MESKKLKVILVYPKSYIGKGENGKIVPVLN
jgi:hypothetical protein